MTTLEMTGPDVAACENPLEITGVFSEVSVATPVLDAVISSDVVVST